MMYMMKANEPERLTLGRFKKIFEDEKGLTTRNFYVGEGYGVTRQAIDSARKFIANGDPFVLEDMRVGVITEGEAHVMIGLKPYRFTRGTMVFANRNTIVQFQKLSPDCNLTGVMVHDTLFRQLVHDTGARAFDPHVQVWVKALDETEMAVFIGLIRLLTSCSTSLEQAHDLLKDQVPSILHFYQYLYEADAHEASQSGHTREQEIFDRFISLVNETKGTQRQLAYYADKLCLTQRYVGTVVKHVSGLSAKEWIDRSAVTNIKVMLHQRGLSITEVADRMMFPTVSFFCKYFKRLTGMTPMEYKGS